MHRRTLGHRPRRQGLSHPAQVLATQQVLLRQAADQPLQTLRQEQ